MEGKGVRAVIMGLLILGLVVAQIEAKSCCRNTTARNCYNVCRLGGSTQRLCANLCDCIHITGAHCPASHPRSSMLENYSDDVIEEVTTTEDLEASRPGPILFCPTPEAKACNDRCRMAPWACAQKCGCIYVPAAALN